MNAIIILKKDATVHLIRIISASKTFTINL